MITNIDTSDLWKILDCLRENEEYHIRRDQMNAAMHLAKEPRYSPLTSITRDARERLERLIGEIRKEAADE